MPATANQNAYIAAIRLYEANNSLKPVDIKKHDDGGLTISVDALTLYQTISPDQLKGHYFRRFWNWLNDRDDSFDCERHQQKLADTLGNSVTGITVRKRYVKLPIPYFNIPLWPLQRSGTKVRDWENLATQPVKISLTFSANLIKDNTSKTLINQIIFAARTSCERAGQPSLPDAAKRSSRDVMTNIFKVLGSVIPSELAMKLTHWLPNKLVRALGRTDEWGTESAKYTLDTPASNSGIIAMLTNGVIALAGIIVVVGAQLLAICSMGNGHSTAFPDCSGATSPGCNNRDSSLTNTAQGSCFNPPNYKWGPAAEGNSANNEKAPLLTAKDGTLPQTNTIYNSRSNNLFFATTVKIQHRVHNTSHSSNNNRHQEGPRR